MASSGFSNSSKVKVEYTDPSNTFHLISDDLHARLPLRNLNWNSTSRPLRSIDSLFVELVPDDKKSSQFQKRSASTAGVHGAQENGLSTLGNEHRRDSEPITLQKERRHQIPGLRQTPYLKVYLLRCDDVETYKSSSRKLLREWVKEHTPPSQNSNVVSSQENHDAFEWMIIHVFPIDTTVASGQATRVSSNVLDRIKADFNGSSKATVDRVAQVPAVGASQASGSRPNSSSANISRGETSQAWEDLVGKAKSLILTSFDLRVRQYEEDIKEKGSQRNLPGWNFCTFFVLKEGLAKGFENVGLVEDALIGYDELSVELEGAIREQKEKSHLGQQADLFRDNTQEMLHLVELAFQSLGKPPDKAEDLKRSDIYVLNSEKKQYRELILANNISAFDFRSYVFSRQFALLLRIANVAHTELSSAVKALHPESGRSRGLDTAMDGRVMEDMQVLSETCRRAVRFITSGGSAIREDIRTSFMNDQGMSEILRSARFNIIEDLIASWTFTLTQQILTMTNTQLLTKHLLSLSNDTAQSLLGSRPISPLERDNLSKSPPNIGLPKRTSSLLGHSFLSPTSPARVSFSNFLPSTQRSPIQSQAVHSIRVFAAQRAELCLIARRALGSLGLRRGWKTGWRAITPKETLNMEDLDDVSLDSDSQQKLSEIEYTGPVIQASSSPIFQDAILQNGLSSKSGFYIAYEDFTLATLQLCQLSDNEKSIQGVSADIAILRFYLGDYETAATYFHDMAPYYNKDDWTDLEICVLGMYALCLKQLERLGDYVHISLKLIAKMIKRGRQFMSHEHSAVFSTDDIGTQGTKATPTQLASVIIASKGLKAPVSTPMKDYFDQVRVSPFLKHFPIKDGFQLMLHLRPLMLNNIQVDQIKIKIVSVGEKIPGEIWLVSDGPLLLEPKPAEIPLDASITLPGWYIVDKIMVMSGNIIFDYDLQSSNEGGLFTGPSNMLSLDQAPIQEPQILIWPSQNALVARLDLCREIRLEENRSVVAEISTGRNEISKGELLVRAGSAGLRLHISDAELIKGSTSVARKPEAGVIHFGNQSPDATLRFKIPYRLDTDMKEITVKLEVTYTTAQGEFTYGNTYSLSILLPLGVNVQDNFKERALFSKFAISASTSIPLQLSSCHLDETENFTAQSPPMERCNLFVSMKQPASMIYKISHRNRIPSSTETLQSRLSMHIKYRCLDEEVCSLVEESLLDHLRRSNLIEYSRLLVPLLEQRLRSRLVTQDLEAVGITKEIEMGTFQEFQWKRNLAVLSPDERENLTTCLLEWHKDYTKVELPEESTCKVTRHIIIPVDVPQMHVVHTVCLHLFREALGDSSPVAVGEGVLAEIKLKHSRRWDTRGEIERNRGEALVFHYTIEASPDTWLVGGQRRAQFTAAEDQVIRFSILLIPQRPGHLLFPSIDIRPVEDQSGVEQDVISPQSVVGASPLICDVDYQNHGESLLVIPNASSTTVGFDHDGPSGGVWLVESESKHVMTSVR